MYICIFVVYIINVSLFKGIIFIIFFMMWNLDIFDSENYDILNNVFYDV